MKTSLLCEFSARFLGGSFRTSGVESISKDRIIGEEKVHVMGSSLQIFLSQLLGILLITSGSLKDN